MVPLWRGWGFHAVLVGHFSTSQVGAPFHYFWGACLGYYDPSPFTSRGVRRGSNGGDVRVSPCMQRSIGSPSSPPAIAGYEWVRDNVLKYKSSLTFAVNVATLQC